MVIEHLAVQAGDALVGIDVSFRMDRLHRALIEAAHAGIAALAVAPQPVEHAQAPRYGQRGAERAEIAAEEALDEEAGDEQRDGEGDEPPLAHEAEDDRGLEGLDLRELLGQR